MAGAWARLRQLPPGVQDVALAAALSLYAQWELTVADVLEGPEWAQRLTFLAMTAAVAGRRTRPLLAAVVGASGLALQTPLGAADAVGGFLAVMMVTHGVALRCARRAAVTGLVAILAGVHLYDVLQGVAVSLTQVVANAAIFLTIWGLGRGARRWRLRNQELQDHAARAERERETQLRAAVAEERTRLARELHDIVAHGVSLMTLQAGAARAVLDTQPAQACESLRTVESSGRQTLDELHRLLGLLRSEGEDEASAPVVDLGRLGDLVAQVRRTGLDVRLAVHGDATGLPASVQASAFRIVQEALTNTVKHSPATRADVLLRLDPDQVEIDVRDVGPPPGTAGAEHKVAGVRHGLVGMRERVALFGGDLVAGPREDGGWAVRAQLPVRRSA